MVQDVQIGGRGGGNLDKIQKNSNFFSWNHPLVGSDIKSESEKEGGVFGECISKQYIVAVFKIKILKSHLCKVWTNKCLNKDIRNM